MRQELGLNKFGERVFIDDAGNLKAVNVVTGQSAMNGNSGRRVDLSTLASNVRALAGQVKRVCTPSLATRIERELERHRGVAALVNERTGKVATFMAPKPYWSKNEVGPDASVEELEAAIAKLTASLDGLQSGERAKVEHNIRLLERQLTVARSNDEVARRNRERRVERKKHRYG